MKEDLKYQTGRKYEIRRDHALTKIHCLRFNSKKKSNWLGERADLGL